jgi:hypothetical protein
MSELRHKGDKIERRGSIGTKDRRINSLCGDRDRRERKMKEWKRERPRSESKRS